MTEPETPAPTAAEGGSPPDPAIVVADVEAPVEPPVAEPAPVTPDPAAALAEARAEVERLTAESAAKDFAHAVERAGVTDPDAPDIIEHLYSKVKAPEGGEKPTLGAWLADRANLPKAVLAYLPAVVVVGDPAAPPPVDLPDANGGARPAPAGSQFSATAIVSMIGNPEAYAANRDAIMVRIGGKPGAPLR